MDATDLLVRLGPWDRGAGHPSTQLARAITTAASEGRLPTGLALPAERQLASTLGVSRGTVARTYARLRETGVAHTRHGAGTTIGSADGSARGTGSVLRSDSILAAIGEREPGIIDLRVAAWDGDPSVLAALEPGPDDLADAVLGHDGYWPLGIPPLREAIAARLSAQGLPTTGDQIIVTNGAQQAIDVVLTTLTRPGDPVAVERTSWPGIFELLVVRHLRSLGVSPVAEDHVPLLRVLRERHVDLAYLVPTFHNPTGAVLAAPARRLVVEAAAEGGGVVIDDLTQSEMWIDGPPPPPLAATLPGAGSHVVTTGSLSKMLWGGLRTGWIRAEGRLLRELARVKTAFDLGNSVPSQLLAARALAHADDVVAGRRAELRVRRDALVTALAHHLSDWSVSPPAGGMSLLADIGVGAGDRLAAVAGQHGVRIPSARVCSVDGSDVGHVRLTLGRPAGELEQAAQRLAAAWAGTPRRQRLGDGTVV